MFGGYLPAKQRVTDLERELKALYQREAELQTKLHQQEVRRRRREGVATRSQPLREERALLENEPSRLVPVLRVLEGGERRDLTEPVDVVGRAHAVQAVARLRGRHCIAHPKARERRDL